MPSVASDGSTTKSGIALTSTGDRHIPSSTRADGTLRKEIKVRPGYRPPEDVEVYKNRTADAWKSRGKGGVPGAEYADSGRAKTPTSKPAKAKKEAGKTPASNTAAKAEDKTAAVEVAQPAEPVDPEAEKEKEARKLSKKLRQARELQQKKEDEGQALLLLPEQFDKIIKINELVRQLDKLGFDAEGRRKASKP